MNGRVPLLLWLLVMVSLLGAACSSAPDNLADYPEWDLVFISDSSGWHVGEVYAEYVEEDTGIPVNLHDASVGGLSAGQVLAALQGEHMANANLNQLSDLIPEAEIVVFSPIQRTQYRKHVPATGIVQPAACMSMIVRGRHLTPTQPTWMRSTRRFLPCEATRQSSSEHLTFTISQAAGRNMESPSPVLSAGRRFSR
jgi:hypothetical protein